MRRNVIQWVTLILVFSICAILRVQADEITIQLASVGTAVTSAQTNSVGATVAITADPVWAAALPGSSWVSFAQTNDQAADFYLVPNGTVVSFFDIFNVPGTPTGGSITVLADDSASVILNGVTLLAEASTVGNTYQNTHGACSDLGIGCVVPTTIILPVSLLQSGSNTLEFDVAQRAGGSFGLDYTGFVTDPVNTDSDGSIDTPEPNSAVMLSFGLLMLGILGYRNRRMIPLK